MLRCQFLGRWYTVASYGNSTIKIDAEVTQLTHSDVNDDVISLLFTGAVYVCLLSLLTYCLLTYYYSLTIGGGLCI